MTDPRTPRREDEWEDDKGLDGDLPRGRRPRPGIDAPEIDRRRVRPEDEDRNQPDDPRAS